MSQAKAKLAQTILSPKLMGKAEAAILCVDGQFVYQWNMNGASHSKIVSAASLKAAFAGQGVDSGWIPPGLVRWGSSLNGEWFFQVHPAREYELLIMGRTDKPSKIKAKLPSLLFAGCGRKYSIWALKEQFRPGVTLYNAPLPNVHPDGAICWGANKAPLVSALGIIQAWNLFWASPFSSHLAGSKSQKHQRDCRILLRAAKRSYPLNDLVIAGMNVEKICQGLAAAQDRNGAMDRMFDVEGPDFEDDEEDDD